MSLEQRNDDLLFNITQQTGKGVHGLLDSVFGFLQRRTDFFYEMEPGDNMGFPPQVAESMVYQYFKKYQDVHFKKFPHKPELEDRWKAYREKQEQAKKEAQEAPKPNESQPAESKPKASQEEEKEPVKASQAPKEAEQPKPQPVEKKPLPKVDEKMKEISTYNGDKTDKYNWSQSVTDVMVQIPVPEGTKPKQLVVVIKPKYLSVALKGSSEPIVAGDFCEKVKVEDSYWTIEDDKYLTINFEKAYEAIWKCIILGDKEIDTKTVDNSKKIEEFDLETQGHLQKVLYEQERKKRGLLTTEEEEQRKLMEKVMGGDGNPFKGLPYDPKKYGQNPSNNGPSPPFAQ